MKSQAFLFLLLLITVLCVSCTLVGARRLQTGAVSSSSTSQRFVDVNDDPTVNVNDEMATPIIGVLTQEVSNLILRKYPDRNLTSYIAASYVKFVEGAGGRVVPIWIGQSRDYYADIMSKINGVLLPGGATYFNQSQGYAEAGTHIYDIAIEMNDQGTYMPIWGTCLGFELLVYLSANGSELRTDCQSSSQALPLEFLQDFEKSRLFNGASAEIIELFKTFPVTANFHIFCFTQETFAAYNMTEQWKVMSVNHDWNGAEFISSIEHRYYPFYGVQFHPEKNLYEFIANRNITHTSQAVQTSQYFADFFVGETRRNKNHFGNKTEEAKALIYNYQPDYTGAVGSAFAQQYLFEGVRSGATAPGVTAATFVGLALIWLSVFANEKLQMF